MKTMAVAAAMFWFVGCGDTINYNYGNPDWVAKKDTFVENDTFYTDNTVEPDSHIPLTDVEEWAPGCNPPFPDGMWVACKLYCSEPCEEGQDQYIWVGPCQLVWDKSSCTASSSPNSPSDGECWYINGYRPELFNDCIQVDPPKEDIVEETDVEEWAPGCDPPWPDGTGVSCKDGDFVVDFCQLSWDKSSCTASCWDFEYSSNAFEGATPEAVSALCHPIY